MKSLLIIIICLGVCGCGPEPDRHVGYKLGTERSGFWYTYYCPTVNEFLETPCDCPGNTVRTEPRSDDE